MLKLLKILIICTAVFCFFGCAINGKNHARQHLHEGIALLNNAQIEEALKEFDRVLETADAKTCILIASILRQKGHLPESLRYIEYGVNLPAESISEQPSMNNLWVSETLTVKGDLLYEMDRINEAEEAYRMAVNANEFNATAMNNWGYMLVEADMKLDKALKLILNALEFEPQNGHFLDSAGWAYFKKGDLGNSLKYMKQAVKYSPNVAEIRYHLGKVYEDKGLLKDALVEYYKSLKLSPSFQPAKKSLSECLIKVRT